MKIEYGCSRIVLLIGKYAFKLPTIIYKWGNFLKGLLHNMQEARFAHLHKECRLCPVVFHLPGGFLVVMPRCRELTTEEYERLAVYEDFGKGYMLEIEDKASSFGWLNGEIVAIDYGD